MTGPFLTTPRFELWQPRMGDVDGLVRLVDDEETRRFLGPARADHPNQFERWMRNAGSWSLFGYGTLAVRWPGSDAIIASCGIFHTWRGFGKGMDDVPEAGWIVRHDHWGQGIASEAMQAMVDWFDATHGPRRVVCMIEQGNRASEALAAKLGFNAYDQQFDEEDDVALILYQRSRGA